MSEQQENVEVQGAEAQQTPEERATDAMTVLEDVMGDPTAEEMTVQPAAGDPAAAVGAQPVDAGAKAVEPAAVQVPEPTEVPSQREDGKWQMGKFVADDLPSLVVKVNKARAHAESYAGQKSPEKPFAPIDPETGEPVEQTGNPFAKSEGDDELEEFNEDDPFTADEFEQSIAQNVAQQLAPLITPQQNQAVPAGVDPVALQQAQSQVYAQANEVVNSEHATPAHFRQVLQNLVMYAPQDKDARTVVLQAWSELPGEQMAAFQESMEIDAAFQRIAQEQHNAQLLAEAQRQYEADAAVEAQQEQVVQEQQEAFAAAWQAFEARHRDEIPQFNAGMDAYLLANQKLMERAKGDPEAIFSVLETSLQIAKATGAPAAPAGVQAGIQPGASEQGSNMSNVNTMQVTPEQRAAAQAAHDQQVDWATLETGMDVGGPIDVAITNPSKAAGAEQVPLNELIGLNLVQ